MSEYKQAKEKVLFKGWRLSNEDFKQVEFHHPDGSIHLIDFESGYTVEDFCDNDSETIKFTESATTKISAGYVKSDGFKSILLELFEEIKHGDDEHVEWLRNKILSFIEQKNL